MIINKKKNQQIKINKKPLNAVVTEERNRFGDRTGYYVIAFLFQVLVAVGRPYFYLILPDYVVRD